MIFSVITEFDNADDARALADLIRELGYETRVEARSLENNARPLRETRLGKIVLARMALNKNRSYTSEDIAETLVEHDYAPRSAAVVLSKLAEEGTIKRIKRGIYRLI